MDSLPSVLVSFNRYKAEQYLVRDPSSVGLSLIINIDRFTDEDVYPDRNGSITDVELLKETFRVIGFSKTEVIKSDNRDNIIKRLQDIACEPLYTTQADMFMCVILSYGGTGYFYDNKGQKVFFSEILNLFKGKNCPGLVLKPKIFINQVCNKKDSRIVDRSRFAATRPSVVTVKHPDEADFITYTSTVSGWFSWNNDPGKGTKFIESLSSSIKEDKELNFDKLVIKVNADMDLFIKSLSKKDLELPLCTSNLTKTLMLSRFIDE